jgi:hypothetical protein
LDKSAERKEYLPGARVAGRVKERAPMSKSGPSVAFYSSEFENVTQDRYGLREA